MSPDDKGANAKDAFVLTRPGWRCTRDVAYVLVLWRFISHLAAHVDHAGEVARQALARLPEEFRPRMDEKSKPGKSALEELNEHERLLSQMIHCRTVDSYLAYISELLALIFTTRPETLRSGEMVRLDEILKHSAMDELVNALAERKVNELAYQGMRDLSGYLSDRLGFSLFQDEKIEDQVVYLVEIRNLIVHNRGAVNRVFLHRVPHSPARLGEPVEVDFNSVGRDINFLLDNLEDIDRRAAAKFDLPRWARPTD